MPNKLKKVEILSVHENTNPKFIKTELLKCEREGQEFLWERIKFQDSVHVLIDNVETREIILVKQVRIPVLVNDDSQNGEIIEVCAGLVDKDVTIQQIAKEEVLEECGYDIPVDDLEFLKSMKSSVGVAGTNSHAFIARVDETMKVSEGGGLPEEDIEVVRIPYDEVDTFFFDGDSHTDVITMFLITYWLFKFRNSIISSQNS